MVKVVELNDGVVLLRPYNLGDVDILYSAARESQNELWPWMPWCHADYSVEESRKYIEECAVNRGNGTWYDFAIVDAKTGLYIGGCGINHIAPDDGMANLGYWVRTSQTGRGVATRAATLAARFGINELKLNRIDYSNRY